MQHREIWSRWIVKAIYLQWLMYIIFSYQFLKPTITKLKEKETINSFDLWLLSIYVGVFAIFLAYSVGAYTSYIVGALSFTFIFYLVVLLLIFKNRKEYYFFNENSFQKSQGEGFEILYKEEKSLPIIVDEKNVAPKFEQKEKYKNKEIDTNTLQLIEKTLPIIAQNELFLNPNLTLAETAQELQISKHLLSQYINEKLGKSFNSFINEFRIDKAKDLLLSNKNYSVEGVGYESGFNSKATFFTVFKKLTGQTPAAFQKTNMK